MTKWIIFFSLYLYTSLFAQVASWNASPKEPDNTKKIDGKPHYVITNADELLWFANKVNSGETSINAYFSNNIDIKLINDTYLTDYSHLHIFIESFNGILNGNGHTLNIVGWTGGYSFLRIRFINTLLSDGIIKNLSVKQQNNGQIDFINENNGIIENVQSYLSVGNEVDNKTTGGIVHRNNGTITKCIHYGNGETRLHYHNFGGIAGENNGTISFCENRQTIWVPSGSSGGGIAAFNKGKISFCINKAKIGRTNNYSDQYASNIAAHNEKNGEVIYSYGTEFLDCDYHCGDYITNEGLIDNFYAPNYYYISNSKTESSEEIMQTTQFAWMLNTSNGTKDNSGVWTRGTDGYPTFANEDSLAIRKVVFDDDGTTSNRYTNYKGLVTFPEDPEPAEGYIFTGWYNADGIKVKPTTVFTADQTVNAVYMDASDVYWTINFYNAAPADTLLEGKSYQHGSIVTYGGADPTLTATAKYSYTFKGWDVEPTNAVEDFNYHAIYDSTIRSYTITFNNSDGSKIESATFEYGKMPSCSKAPTRDTTVEWKYTHKGWNPALDAVTEDATYTAIYDSVKVEYKVTFMNGTEVIDEQMVPYGDAAVAPTNVTREGYKFVGWNTSFAKVTTALTVKALFEELIIRTVNVVNGEGEKIDNQKIEDGEKYTLPEAPKKDGYTFDAYYDGNKKIGVVGDEISVTSNITITAKYIKNPESSSSVAKSSSSSKEIASSSSQNSAKSSSSTKINSSSSSIKSSSSEKTDAIIATKAPLFSVHIAARNLQISGARVGSTYALFDMQGKVLLQGRTQAANFDLNIARSGNYLLKIGNSTQKIRVK